MNEIQELLKPIKIGSMTVKKSCIYVSDDGRS